MFFRSLTVAPAQVSWHSWKEMAGALESENQRIKYLSTSVTRTIVEPDVVVVILPTWRDYLIQNRFLVMFHFSADALFATYYSCFPQVKFSLF